MEIPQSRAPALFKPKHVAFNEHLFKTSCGNDYIKNQGWFYVHRKPTESNQYLYFICPTKDCKYIGNNKKICYALGKEDGRCMFETMPTDENRYCGFQDAVLLACIEDREKEGRGGFDPTAMNPNKDERWQNQRVALIAKERCASIIYTPLTQPLDTLLAGEELLNVLNAVFSQPFGTMVHEWLVMAEHGDVKKEETGLVIRLATQLEGELKQILEKKNQKQLEKFLALTGNNFFLCDCRLGVDNDCQDLVDYNDKRFDAGWENENW